MSLKMSEFHGIEPSHVTSLRVAGIDSYVEVRDMDSGER